jgi:glycosyltransferase involved in cell wall biosynthesis
MPALVDSMSLSRVAVVCDLLEENWPSMDLVGEMLLSNLRKDHSASILATCLRPPMRRRFTRVARAGNIPFNADRFLNRFWDYPRWLGRQNQDFDLFHVVDHSYAQLVHQLPAARTVVTCHDLDLFLCLLDSAVTRRSPPFKAMARYVLRGLCKATRVTCDSDTTRNQLIAYGIVPAERLVTIRNGVHPSCMPAPDLVADAEAARLLGPIGEDAIEILHVGSTIPRKRIDVLVRVFASLREELPKARLIRVGGPLTAAQAELVDGFSLREAVVELPFLDRSVLAAVYRRAALLLQPSEREGFGLPVIEALACGTPVVASDLPVLKEAGGQVATYCTVGDVRAWSESIIKILYERRHDPDRWSVRRLAGIAHARKFSWAAYTKQVVALYHQLLDS